MRFLLLLTLENKQFHDYYKQFSFAGARSAREGTDLFFTTSFRGWSLWDWTRVPGGLGQDRSGLSAERIPGRAPIHDGGRTHAIAGFELVVSG